MATYVLKMTSQKGHIMGKFKELLLERETDQSRFLPGNSYQLDLLDDIEDGYEYIYTVSYRNEINKTLFGTIYKVDAFKNKYTLYDSIFDFLYFPSQCCEYADSCSNVYLGMYSNDLYKD